MVVFTVNFSVIIYDLGLASLALHLDLVSSHSTQRIIRSEWRQLCQRPQEWSCMSHHMWMHTKERGGEESPVFSVKGTFDLSQPQQRTRQVSWKKLRGGKRKIRRLHLKSRGWAWIPNCHRSFPRSMSVCGVPAFSWVAPGSCLLSQPGWWHQHHQLSSGNPVPILWFSVELVWPYLRGK